MEINIENNNLELTIDNSSFETEIENSNEDIDIILENKNLDLEVSNSSLNFGIGMQTIYEKNHKNLENLDYENSGHTGFQPAGNYALKSEIPDISNLATKEEIPNVSQFATKDEIPNVGNFATKEEIPTKTSQLTNDSGFLTEHQKLSDYIKNTDYATTNETGVIKIRQDGGYGLTIDNVGTVRTRKANNTDIDNKTNNYYSIVPSNLDYAVKSGLASSNIEWGEEEKENARNLLGITEYIDEIVGDIETLLGGI